MSSTSEKSKSPSSTGSSSPLHELGSPAAKRYAETVVALIVRQLRLQEIRHPGQDVMVGLRKDDLGYIKTDLVPYYVDETGTLCPHMSPPPSPGEIYGMVFVWRTTDEL